MVSGLLAHLRIFSVNSNMSGANQAVSLDMQKFLPGFSMFFFTNLGLKEFLQRCLSNLFIL